MIEEMAKQYSPKEIENKWYTKWEEAGYFKPEINPEGDPFTIVMPPPNITGQLHMGHAFDGTLQDVIIRWKRMQGYAALWLPGTDHASIATEVKVVNKIREEEGKTKLDLGREEFLNRAWEWAETYKDRITHQFRELGASCDWSRERFTMDVGCSNAVKRAFVNLYNKDLIYKGNRIINWCPDCKTALSDAEVEYVEKDGKLWHIKYPIKDSNEYLVVATTRPETILGDSGVAVNPEDDRYTDIIGKTVILPILQREIPVVADDYVDMTFGSGAVKMTPAHDPNDFEVGMRHGLEQIRVMNDDGTMNALAGKYEGMDRYECRKAILKDLEELGLVEDIKEHVHNVGGCYRCGTTVETITSEQWFVDMKPLAAPAIDVVKKGETNFIPERFSKIYFNWLENIKDWCISRQLWWGHRIPAYYCENCGEMMVAEETPLKCTKCGYSEIVQDEDVLDTWFSSGLWPFSTLGWPEETKDLKKFYPNNVLVTGYDIIFFWVARMIFSGIEQMGETPYKDVYIHGLVRDEKGRKMSKSLGNGVDPLEVIHNYSADALRFTIITGNSAGNDIRWIESNLEASRNFANKIWNASRFVMMYLDDEVMNNIDVAKENLSVTDLWIRSRANQVISEVTKNMEKYEFGLAADKVYDFAWNEYCDWYIEFVKPRLYGEDKNSQIAAVYTLVTVLKDILKCLHPFMPFITEEIFSYLPGNKTDIMVSKWPEYNEKYINISAEKEVRVIMEGIKAIRNIRAEMNVVPTKKVAINFIPDNNDIAEIILNAKQYFEKMTAVTGIIILEKETQIENSISRIINGGEIIISLDDLVDKEKEVQRLQTEKVKLEKEIDRVVKKLNNPGFVNKAPEKVVRAEKEKQTQYTDMLDKVLKRLEYYQQ